MIIPISFPAYFFNRFDFSCYSFIPSYIPTAFPTWESIIISTISPVLSVFSCIFCSFLLHSHYIPIIFPSCSQHSPIMRLKNGYKRKILSFKEVFIPKTFPTYSQDHTGNVLGTKNIYTYTVQLMLCSFANKKGWR